ncbi:MAG TPA: T9SS type A sorting domain-containing protein, partial [Chryseolinea sp.]|nr:T9SS type A sorting domain-containing protein [Chryseolinea sp.]
NYGYARYGLAEAPVAVAAHLAADWVRYDNGRTKFWEIGNESNGAWQAGYRIKTADNKDGQPEIITGALYGKHFKVFADSMRKAATEKGSTIYIGAQLLQEEPASWWNATDKTWNTGVFQEAKNLPDYYIIHSYYTPYNANSKAADILSSAVSVTKNMMAYVVQAQSQAGVTAKPIALTEWNIFAVGSKQQVSYINGMHAAMVLGELVKNKYGLACRWDLANAWDNGNDHGMFNQGDEPGGIPKWNARAVFYYMYFFQRYTGDHMVQSSVFGNADIISYASTFNGKDAGVTVVNKGTSEQTVKLEMHNFSKGERYYMHILTGGTDNGEFSQKVFVNNNGPSIASGGPPAFEAIPAQSANIDGGIVFTAPPRSVAYLLIDHGDEVTATMDAEEVKLNVFPNPTSGKLTIQLPAPGFRSVEVFDITGKSIYQETLELSQTSLEIDPSPIRGVYLIRLSGSKNDFVTKVVIE